MDAPRLPRLLLSNVHTQRQSHQLSIIPERGSSPLAKKGAGVWGVVTQCPGSAQGIRGLEVQPQAARSLPWSLSSFPGSPQLTGSQNCSPSTDEEAAVSHGLGYQAVGLFHFPAPSALCSPTRLPARAPAPAQAHPVLTPDPTVPLCLHPLSPLCPQCHPNCAHVLQAPVQMSRCPQSCLTSSPSTSPRGPCTHTHAGLVGSGESVLGGQAQSTPTVSTQAPGPGGTSAQ